jgi:glutamate-5-semialdehyde dehydrogenase
MTTVASELLNKALAARKAARELRSLTTEKKNAVLEAVAAVLTQDTGAIVKANGLDMDAGRKAGLSDSLLDRLMLNEERLSDIAADVRTIVTLPEPIGEVIDESTLPNGIHVERRRVPLGVIGAIYESRPNITIDLSVLCLKSGNAVILRGGKEAVHSNLALSNLVRQALESAGVTPDAVQFIEDTDRALVGQMIKLNEHIDLIIPRGSETLIHYVRDNASVPAITGGIGVVHTYVDETADAHNATEIVFNAKVQRPSVCNALDTVLIHSASAPAILPQIASKLTAAGVEIRCDERALSQLGPVDGSLIKAAGPEDFGKEFLDLVVSVKVVDSLDEAIEHIETHGSGHTEAIITENADAATRFVDEVEASLVLVNASTRFNDGGQLGLGAEVAISTNKLHARGPMGLRELTSYKWIAIGSGQVRP